MVIPFFPSANIAQVDEWIIRFIRLSGFIRFVGFIAICHFTVRATTSWLKSALQFLAKCSNKNNNNNSMMSAIQSVSIKRKRGLYKKKEKALTLCVGDKFNLDSFKARERGKKHWENGRPAHKWKIKANPIFYI